MYALAYFFQEELYEVILAKWIVDFDNNVINQHVNVAFTFNRVGGACVCSCQDAMSSDHEQGYGPKKL